MDESMQNLKNIDKIIMASIYYKYGIVSKGHFIEVDRSGLVGEYLGQTAQKNFRSYIKSNW